MKNRSSNDAREGFDIAIIGMAGRFPGADNLDLFWQNLRDGVESITMFTDEQLLNMGVSAEMLRAPTFVKVGAILEGQDLFDAALYGYSPREAELLDPQHRLFLECAWEALESAGYHTDGDRGLVGVYAGTSLSSYLLFNVLQNSAGAADTFPAMISNDKDFLSTRVSYELNLKGPSVDIQTACSTSLVAVHLACQSLLSYQCDLALSGGVSAQVPQRTGYHYQEGGINSPDGHCRVFDARAAGSVFGSGVGIVVLKRLADALADGDTIHAVIKGSAINNDGSSKIGYTAPSVDGQAQVIAMAQLMAGVEAESISYIEAHGTATILGDPVEIEGLTKAFRASTDKKGFCAIGSVKSNIGHPDAAAGVAGLIKTVLALKHKMLPPIPGFEQPNQRIDFLNSPFYPNTSLKPWDRAGYPRRAGVSSFGIGGTNAHIIVEEAPDVEPPEASGLWSLLPLSTKTGSALETATANLVKYLRAHEDISLADVAYTLQVGRKRFNYRRIAVTCDVKDAIATLEIADPQRVFSHHQEPGDRQVVFMFPGGGAQHVNMGLGLYQQEPTFRDHIDACSELVRSELGYDLREILYPHAAGIDEGAELMKQTSVGLPALFAVEYALAKLWMSWGQHPTAMIGHSLGEYVAACLAGVLSLEDAISLVMLRAKLFEQLPKGAMLSVSLGESEVRALVNGQLSIAAVNGPAQCVVSGPIKAISEMARLLAEKQIESRRLHIDVAAHSEMVNPILDQFISFAASRRLQPPNIPYISNVTGAWIKDEEATNPHYWGKHLRETVRFADGLLELLNEQDRILLEIGPGQTLGTLAKLQVKGSLVSRVFSSMRHPYEKQHDMAVLLTTLGKLWLVGAEINWPALSNGQRRSRLPLPTHPFERQRYWIEPDRQASMGAPESRSAIKKQEMEKWFYLPSWKRTPGLMATTRDLWKGRQRWMVMEDEYGIGERMARELIERGQGVMRVRRGGRRERKEGGVYEIEADKREDYMWLMKNLAAEENLPQVIVHLWTVGEIDEAEPEIDRFQKVQAAGFYSLLYLAQALDEQGVLDPIRFLAVSNNSLEIESNDLAYPEKATLLGPCKVIPQEYGNIICKYVDLAVSRTDTPSERLIEQLLAETQGEDFGAVVAYRGSHRWAQIYESLFLNGHDPQIKPLRDKGVYLITGGLGGIGLLLAEHLARTVQARLALVQRSPFPEQRQWQTWLGAHDHDDPTSGQIRKLLNLEQLGAEVMVAGADVASEEQMRKVVSQTLKRYGDIHGVIHAAGIAGEKAVKMIPEVTRDDCEAQFRSKVYGLYALEKVLGDRRLDTRLLFSSNASVLGGIGSASYTAANLFMDAFAISRSNANGARWVSANWDGWLLGNEGKLTSSFRTSLDQYAMTADEGVEAFRRLVSSFSAGQIVVSTGDLAGRLSIWVRRQNNGGMDEASRSNAGARFYPRPALGTAYVPPGSEIEQTIVSVWGELLGIEQVGIHDNFFDLGGNSLLVLQVISRLKRELKIELPAVTLFERPTVNALAQVISQGVSDDPSYKESRIRGEKRRERRKRKREVTGAAPKSDAWG